jgi:hypothetical protein
MDVPPDATWLFAMSIAMVGVAVPTCTTSLSVNARRVIAVNCDAMFV